MTERNRQYSADDWTFVCVCVITIITFDHIFHTHFSRIGYRFLNDARFESATSGRINGMSAYPPIADIISRDIVNQERIGDLDFEYKQRFIQNTLK